MTQNFDLFHRYEIPEMVLCNPDETRIATLIATQRVGIFRFNDISEISLSVSVTYKDNDAGTDIGIDETNTAILGYYDKIEEKRLIFVEGIGYFVITSDPETDDGIVGTKKVTAKSIQYTLSSKLIENLVGTYNFYNPSTQVDENGNPNSLMALVINRCPGWSIGTIDIELQNKYRSLDVSNQPLLSFLYDYVENAYQLIFDFDILNKTISATSVSTLVTSPNETSIYLSFDNVIKNLSFAQDTKEIQTKLYVYGKDMDIRRVNPLGTAYIIDLHYYKKTEWMPQSLISAINIWETKIESYMDLEDPLSYPSKMVELYDLNDELLGLNSELLNYQEQLKMYESVRDARRNSGLSYSDLTSSMNTIISKISSTQGLITTCNSNITSKNAELAVINNDVKMENNFTSQQRFVLDRYLSEDVYSTDNYIITDQMTNGDIIGFANDLYREGKLKLSRLSEPSLSFTIDSSNFIFVEDFENFTEQLELGCVVNIEKGAGSVFKPLLLEVELPWDEPLGFSTTYGNKFRTEEIGSTYQAALTRLTETKNKVDFNWADLYKVIDTYESTTAANEAAAKANEIMAEVMNEAAQKYTATKLQDDLNSSISTILQNYLESNTDDVNNVSIKDGVLTLSVSKPTGVTIPYVNSDEDTMYWTDEIKDSMTTDITDYPVFTYEYTDQNIGTITIIPGFDILNNPILKGTIDLGGLSIFGSGSLGAGEGTIDLGGLSIFGSGSLSTGGGGIVRCGGVSISGSGSSETGEGNVQLGGVLISGSGSLPTGTGIIKSGKLLISDDGTTQMITQSDAFLLGLTNILFANNHTYIDGIASQVVTEYPEVEEENVLYIKTGVV